MPLLLLVAWWAEMPFFVTLGCSSGINTCDDQALWWCLDVCGEVNAMAEHIFCGQMSGSFIQGKAMS